MKKCFIEEYVEIASNLIMVKDGVLDSTVFEDIMSINSPISGLCQDIVTAVKNNLVCLDEETKCKPSLFKPTNTLNDNLTFKLNNAGAVAELVKKYRNK